MTNWRDLAERLTIEEPWSWSQEGLDDHCMFCGSEWRRYESINHVHMHDDDCVWIEACDALGKPRPQHHTKSSPLGGSVQ